MRILFTLQRQLLTITIQEDHELIGGKEGLTFLVDLTLTYTRKLTSSLSKGVRKEFQNK